MFSRQAIHYFQPESFLKQITNRYRSISHFDFFLYKFCDFLLQAEHPGTSRVGWQCWTCVRDT